MSRKVIEFIKQNQLLSPCDKVVAGVSGGADSLALLHFLHFGSHGLQLKLTACHINHGLRGAESDRDQRHVEQICKEWGVPLVVRQADVKGYAKEHGMGLEEAGRTLRYRIFQELAGENGKIVTAHTLSDRYETLLFNLTRGSGLTGLCGIPAVRGQIVRPFLCLSRTEVEAYCRENSIQYITDSTNFDNLYSRNKIRNQVIPILKEINPQAEKQASMMMQSLKEDADCLEQLAKENFAVCRSGEMLAVEKLAEAPAVRKRVLIDWLEERQMPYSRDKIDRIYQMTLKSYGKISLAGCWCEYRNGFLQIVREAQPVPYFEFEPVFSKRYEMPSGGTYAFFETSSSDIQGIFKNSTYITVDSGKIFGKLILRQRKNGDQIGIYHRNITKSIKKLFNEAKIPKEMREKIFFLCDERGIIYVEGFGIDRRVAPDENTKTYLVIEKEDGSVNR